MAYGVIYTIIDGTNDYEYVGQTTRSVTVRFNEHKNCKESLIGRVIRAHGEDMFEIAILKECASKDELDYWEKHFIKSRDTMTPNGYNLTGGGEGSLGFTHSQETCAKLSARFKGKPLSKEHCAKLSAAQTGEKNPNYGKPRPPETCTKIAAALKGKPHTPERRAKIAASLHKKSPYKNLIAEIDKHQFSYVILAKFMSISPKNISRKMRGERNFSAEDKLKLVKIFCKPIEYLLKRDDE